MENLREMWGLVCEELKKSLNDIIFNIWFAPTEIVDFDGETVKLAVSEIRRITIEKQFGDILSEAFKAVLGFDVKIEMVDPETAIAPEEEKALEPTFSNEENTFDTFIVGGSNRFAYTVAKAVAEAPATDYNPLFIYGSSGLGKTHLLSAIRKEILDRNPDANIIYTRGEDFVNEVTRGMTTKNMTPIHEKFRNCDVLLVDDVQFIAGKERTSEEFFHTFNTLTADDKQIVLISDSTPKDIPQLDARLRSRFEQGIIADIQPPDFETRLAIVERKAANLGLNLSQDVSYYIAEKIKTNIRQLEGAVKKIGAVSKLDGAPISIAMAQNAIRDLASEGLPANELANRIIAETARTFGVSQEELTSKKKENKIVRARQIAIFAIRECTDMTQQEITEFFGAKDRTTIHYALSKIVPDIEKDPALRKSVDNIIRNAKEH